jgi:hypothetical protein
VPTLAEELASLQFAVVPPIPMGGNFRLSGLDTLSLFALAGVTASFFTDGPDPPDDWKKWAHKVLRKASWHELHKRRRRHVPLDAWLDWHHPF